ncbi:MAG: DUF1805 domain-containing protein [Euryarchaeota archaeon]|jgi:uncharacterized protein YunC (DUF1805 family)|nr:DUF1805 domain-containing protein [Euryarchaeota archaeon]
MKEEIIKMGKWHLTGYCIDLGKAPLLILQAKKGYIMCGYLNMNTANKLGDIAGKVTGVKTFDDMLKATVIEVSENAKKEGLTEGMNAQDFLKTLL